MNYKTRVDRQANRLEPNKEYDLQKALSQYLKLFHKDVEYRVDLAGNYMTKAQAGQAKAVNKRRSWHDLEIYDPRLGRYSLCIELKKKGTKLFRSKDSKTRLVVGIKKVQGVPIKIRENFIREKGDWYDLHIEEQADNIMRMVRRKRVACFGVGLKNCLMIIEGYLQEDEAYLKQGMIERDANINFTNIL